MSAARSIPAIAWLQVWGLAGLQGAISLTWVIYNLYLPQFLEQFGFAPEFGLVLLVTENVLGVAIEPLMGSLSDRSLHFVGTRLPFIAIGVVLASACFIAMPAVAIFGNPTGVIRWLLPTTIVAWAIAMAVFRAPATSLLKKYASKSGLPLAASMLTLFSALVGAVKPLARRFILGLGAPATFAIGSFVLLGAVAVLRSVDRRQQRVVEDRQTVEPKQLAQGQLFKAVALLFGIGMAIGWGMRLLMNEIVPRVLEAELAGVSSDLLNGLISIALAFCALGMGAVATRFGNQRIMLLGLGATTICTGLLGLVHGVIAIAIVLLLMVASLSAVLNGAVPLALALMPSDRGGLGIGMYFGGSSAAIALLGYLFPRSWETISLQSGVSMAVVGFLVAGVFVYISNRFSSVTA